MKTIAAILLSACVAASAFAQSNEYNGQFVQPRAEPAADQIIVKWREASASAKAASRTRASKLHSSLGAPPRSKHRITPDTDVLTLDRRYAAAELNKVLSEIAANPDVEYAVADQRRWAHAIPSDPLYVEQWYLSNVQASATRAEQAWDTTVGTNTTVVAVIDTGVRFEHPDLGRSGEGGKLLPGFDFIADPRVANDGDGIDDDASDPGDWITTPEALQPPFTLEDCIPATRDQVDSSWHGTRVSTLIAAVTNNTGIAGTGWNTLVLPVRVLGKCGGTDSDIIAGMRWAAGLPVNGVPLNPTPANIINLSLGGTSDCSVAYQNVIDAINARGILIVASAGNEGGPVGAPANCQGVVGVTGLRHAGTKVGFSNLGPGADLGAPAGNCVNIGQGEPCLFSIVAATNSGTTVPQDSTYTDQFRFNVGTSFAAPLVAGTAALMHSLNHQLAPADYTSLLRENASPFPAGSTTSTTVCHAPVGEPQAEECVCTVSTCGAGMLNTQAAVLAAQRPFAKFLAPVTIKTATDIILDGSRSVAADGRTITSYQWSALNVTGATPVFANASAAQTTLRVSGTSRFTLQLLVTDDQGAQDTAQLGVATPDPIPGTTPSRRGGGGSFGAAALAIGLLRLLRGRYLRRR